MNDCRDFPLIFGGRVIDSRKDEVIAGIFRIVAARYVSLATLANDRKPAAFARIFCNRMGTDCLQRFGRHVRKSPAAGKLPKASPAGSLPKRSLQLLTRPPHLSSAMSVVGVSSALATAGPVYPQYGPR